MLKISDAIREIIDGNPLFQMGLGHRLLNLSQVAKHIHPLVEARTKKSVRVSAILMNLSRLQRQHEKSTPPGDFKIDNIIIHSDLVVLTFPKTKEVHSNLSSLYGEVLRKNGFITITEGVNEITSIIERKHMDLLKEELSKQAIRRHDNVSSLGVKFDEHYLDTPGFLYLVFQQLFLQNINIVEVLSTATELIVYLDKNDVRLAFDTLYNRFAAERS